MLGTADTRLKEDKSCCFVFVFLHLVLFRDVHGHKISSFTVSPSFRHGQFQLTWDARWNVYESL